jgi:hypothetical protein
MPMSEYCSTLYLSVACQRDARQATLSRTKPLRRVITGGPAASGECDGTTSTREPSVVFVGLLATRTNTASYSSFSRPQ